MNNEEKHVDTDNVKEAVKKVVEEGKDVRDEVRDITMQALSKGQIELERVKSVVKSVWDGATEGVGQESEKMKHTFNDVMSGLDDALEKSAQASKLAIEETAGKVKDFSQEDLKRAIDDLKGLEEMLLDTISDVAKSSKSTVADVLHDTLEHAKNSGTEVGQKVLKDIDQLRAKLGENSKDTLNTVGHAASNFTADVADAASGILAGIADTLKKPKNK